MRANHFLSIADLDSANLLNLVDRACTFGGVEIVEQTLSGIMVGIYFTKTSTRTRSAFSIGASKLGANVVSYGPHDLQTNTGESVTDTAYVLSQYLDILVIRTAGDPVEMQKFAISNQMAVVNAMSAQEHPTQAIADLSTLKAEFGDIHGLKLLYVGEGNNTAIALVLASSLVPRFEITLITPKGYGVPSSVMNQAAGFARTTGAVVQQYHDFSAIPKTVDAVYTTRWQTTGTQKADHFWKEKFLPFRVSADLMERVSKPSGTVFMHDLPAVRGEDVESSVIDGAQSIVFAQAKHKMFSAMAILERCM